MEFKVSDSFSETFLSVGEEIDNIMQRLNTIITKLNEEILKLRADEAATVDAALLETSDPKASEQFEDDSNPLNSHGPLEFVSGHKQDAEERDDQSHAMLPPGAEPTSDLRLNSSDCHNVEETGIEIVVKGQGNDNEDCGSPQRQTDFLEETNENDTDKEEKDKEWITVG